MSFYSVRLNAASNHVSKTCASIDVVTWTDLELPCSPECGALFTRAAIEADNTADESKECADIENSLNSKASTSDAQLTTSHSEEAPAHPAALADIAGIIAPQGGTLVFTAITAALAEQSSNNNNNNNNNTPSRVILTTELPSGKPIAATTRISLRNARVGHKSDTTTSCSAIGDKREREGDQFNVNVSSIVFVVVDTVGNVYLFEDLFTSLSLALSRKGPATPAQPTLIAAASASEPMAGALPLYSLGAGGWVGATHVKTMENGDVVLAVGRENARDVRVICFNPNALRDEATGASPSVIASFYTAHAPTSLAVIHNTAKGKEWDSLIAVANGPLVTFYDSTLISKAAAVKTRGESANTNTALKTPLRSPYNIMTTRNIIWSVASVHTTIASSANSLDEATNTCRNVAAPCLLWVASSDRSVFIVDACRNFMKIQSAPNVLKYDAVTAALASTCVTSAEKAPQQPALVVVSGIDCEVRGVTHLDSRLPGTYSIAKEEKAAPKAGGEAVAQQKATAPDTHNPSSFRGRLNTAVHGEDVWVGAWRSFIAGNNTCFAAGLTRNGALYVLAQNTL